MRALPPRAATCIAWLAAATAGLLPALGDDRERVVQDGVPQGRITSGTFSASTIFPGTTRDYRVYVPAQYQGGTPACLMVFQDGPGYWKPDGAFRVPIVFDNLIHRQAMPVTIAVFVTPGTVPPTKAGATPRSNRSFEYDSLGDRYARFLVEELLPAALAGLDVSSDPKRRAICGISSGGICAFTAAWERPDQFGKVLSHIGSFTNIRGGWAYPGLIRKTKGATKPLKIWFQDGRDDLDNLHGNWPLANEDLAAAFRYAGYEHRFVMTEGGHSGGPGGEILPEALRWLWADQMPGAATGAGSADVPRPVAVAADEKPRPPTAEPHADAVQQDGVPQGTVEKMPPWESKVFPGTTREWAVYVPPQYRRESPAAVMIFQDGHTYLDGKGRWRVPVVFDNLIARGVMPPTIAVFLDPGHETAQAGSPTPPTPWQNSNRSNEYDSLGDRYARFLVDEILPEVEKRYAISTDPRMRAICGMSSGGICAFTAAWERPDQFGKVLSHIGSFTNIRGGDVYPSLIRKTEPKPLRVYLEDCGGDLDNQFGNWPLANRQMAAALASMGYDHRFDYAEGFAHDANHGGPLFPAALEWLWRPDASAAPFDVKGKLGGDMPLRRLLAPAAPWEVVVEGLGFADAPCADAEGNFYFCDMKAPAVHRIGAADGSRSVIVAEAVSGLEFGPDGLLYGCQGAKQRVISIDPRSGAVKEVATGVSPNDLAVTTDGFLFFTETKERQVTRVNLKTGEVAVADTGLEGPNGIALTGDGGTLAVSEYRGGHAWTYRVNPDGSLDAKMPTMTLRLPIDRKAESRRHEPPAYEAASKGDGMAVDAAGRFYVTSAVGVQVFDPTSRSCGVLATPNPAKPLTSCVLAGPGHEYLHVTNGDTVYRRRLKLD